jgi:hypothetical protein
MSQQTATQLLIVTRFLLVDRPSRVPPASTHGVAAALGQRSQLAERESAAAAARRNDNARPYTCGAHRLTRLPCALPPQRARPAHRLGAIVCVLGPTVGIGLARQDLVIRILCQVHQSLPKLMLRNVVASVKQKSVAVVK